MPISRIILVPTGHSAISICPLMLTKLAPKSAPAKGAAGTLVGIVINPMQDPSRRYKSKLPIEVI